MNTVLNFKCNHHVATFTPDSADDDEYPLSDDVLGMLGEYTFVYSYPLSVEAKFTHEMKISDDIVDVLIQARKDYEEIYRQEDASVGDPGNIPGMLNRATSNGPHGIWGHDLSDLYFEGVKIDVEKKIISFEMGS